MKKILAIGSLVVSMSVITPVYAGPFSTSATAAGAAELAAEGTALAIGAAGVGTVVVGVGAGFGTAHVMNDKLFTSGAGLCKSENSAEACNAAQVGTWTGAGLGSAGVLAAVAVCGADIAGLTVIGSTIGGGLLTGIATVVIAPVVVAAAGGYAAYYFWPTDWKLFGDTPTPPTTP